MLSLVVICVAVTHTYTFDRQYVSLKRIKTPIPKFISLNSNVRICHSGVIYRTSPLYTSADETLRNIKRVQVAQVKVSSIDYW